MKIEGRQLRLYAVTDRTWARDTDGLLRQVADAIDGGAGIVQLREKHLDKADFLAEAERFFGIKDKLIRYSFGNGVSTASVRGKSGYIWFARRETACKAAEAYLSDRKRGGQYSEALQNRRKEFFRSALCAWLFECPAEYSAEIFDEIVSEYGAEAAAEALREGEPACSGG